MSHDYHEDRAYEAGFVPDDPDIVTEREFSQMLRDRVWFDKRMVTEEWLVRQEDARRAAVRDLSIARKLDGVFNVMGYLFVMAVVLMGCAALLAGVAYASQWLYKAVIG